MTCVRSRALPAVLVVLMAGLSLLLGTPPAAAVVGDYANTLSFRIATITPTVITRDGPQQMLVSGTITNTGAVPITELDLRLQRGAALQTSEEITAEIASPAEPENVVTQGVALPGTLQPGAGMPFTAAAQITGSGPAGLHIEAPGVYPVMVNINGEVQATDGSLQARVGELHLLATVLSVPGSLPPGGPAVTGTQTTKTPVPVSMLWPLVDRPHLGVGGVFLDDDLALAIQPGGRLFGLLDLLAMNDPGGRTVSLVVDPMLLDELQRMSVGYRVAAPPGAPQPALTPSAATPTTSTTSTGAKPSASSAAGGTAMPPTSGAPAGGSAGARTAAGSGTAAGTVQGTGQEAARSFLHRLRLLAVQYPVILLPYSDPDVLALAHDRSASRVVALAIAGRTTALRVLGPLKPAPGTGLVTTVAVPPDGVADAPTLSALRAAGFGSAVLDGSSVGGVPPVGSANARLTGGTTMPLAVAGSDLLADAATVTATADNAQQVNLLAARMAGEYLDSSAVPMVFLPPTTWSAASAPGLRQLSGLLRTLYSGGAAVGVGPAAVAATATASATVRPPEDAAAPLDPGYLRRVQAARDRMARLRGALTTDTSSGVTAPNPTELFGTLTESFRRVYSSALRTDPKPGEKILSTVDATVATLQEAVSIRSSGQSYTLASSSSPLLVTVQNSSPYAVTVSVVITGGQQAGLRVTQPAAQTIPAGRSQQFRIQAEVSRAGSFTVLATLLGPDGKPLRPPSALSVTSSAYGTATIVIIVLAGVVLLFMVIIRIRQRLRGQPDNDGDQTAADKQIAEWTDPDSTQSPESTESAGGGSTGGDDLLGNAPVGVGAAVARPEALQTPPDPADRGPR